MLVLVDGSLECSKYSTAQHKRANGMDLMENSNKSTNDKNKLINFAPSSCECRIHRKNKTEYKNINTR
jgi:hypothetical protein